MLWLYFSLLAALLYGISVVIAKYAITDELKDPIVGVVVARLTHSIPLVFLLLLFPLTTAFLPAVAGFTAGALYSFASYFWYRAMKEGEASRLTPLINSSPIVVLIISILFLGEIFTPLRYVGIALIIAGAILLSFKKGMSFKKSLVIAMALLSMIFYALRNVSIELSTLGADFLSILPWIGIGGITISLIFLGFHHPHLRKKSWKGVEHIILAEAFSLGGLILFTYAASIGFISLVSAVSSLEIFFVFIIAAILSRHRPHILREEMGESALLLKGISIALIFLGLVLIL